MAVHLVGSNPCCEPARRHPLWLESGWRTRVWNISEQNLSVEGLAQVPGAACAGVIVLGPPECPAGHTPRGCAREKAGTYSLGSVSRRASPRPSPCMAANGNEQTPAECVSCLVVQGRAPSMMTCASNAPEILRRPRQHHVGTRSRRTGCRVFYWCCTIVTVRHRTERLRWPAYSAAFAKWLQVELKWTSVVPRCNRRTTSTRHSSESAASRKNKMTLHSHYREAKQWCRQLRPLSCGTMHCLMQAPTDQGEEAGSDKSKPPRARRHSTTSRRKRGTGARTSEPPTHLRGRLAYGRHYSSSCSTDVIASISCDMVSRRPRNFRSGE